MSRRNRDVALIGMGCRFPGAADLCAFWANVLANRDCTRDVPPDRWDPATFHDPASTANDRVACRRGGYLEGPLDFDAPAHGIMPRTVEGGEPEQFLVLDAARAALADAGLEPNVLRGRRVEVVIGRGNYFNRGNLLRLQHGRIVAQTVGLLAALHPEWSADDLDALRADLKASLPPFEAATIPGQLTNATAGRIAERLDLRGASYVVDAASASSLVALDLGCRALRRGRADLAIVGGVYAEADVDFPLVFRQLGVPSRSGTSRPFGAEADGMVPGEGVGVVVLKRLADAERDGDRVYAVVRGVGLASDGRSQGLAAPSARGHARAIRRAHRAGGVDPGTVELIEGHGLGLPVADRAELRALGAVFPRREGRPRTLGAVSSQIGHTMPAAGMAGLIKAALALHHRVLPPTRGADRPHARVGAAGFALLDAPRPWVHGDTATPRRAGVNAFGFAGINAHAVLEEHAASADGLTPGALPSWDSEAILVAAADRASLADRLRWLADRLRARPEVLLRDVAYTLNVEARAVDAGGARAGLVAGSVGDLIERMTALESRLRDPSCGQVRDARGAYFWERPLGREGGLAFLFPGEGSQYPGMLADLCPHFPELRAVLDMADRIALESGEPEPPSAHLFARDAAAAAALQATDVAVNAVLSSQWALYQVLLRLGLRPDAVAGHSSGELPALAAAGSIEAARDLERALSRLAAIFRELESGGRIPAARLLAVGADRARVDSLCRDVAGDDVLVAIDNCPHQVVVAGPDEPVERLTARLRAEGVLCEALPFARAYHTPAFAAVLGPLESFYEGLAFRAPRTAIYSCATAARMPDEPARIRALAVEQWTRPVRFREAVEAMHRDGLRLFVDVGARGNLCGYVEDVLRGRPAFAIAANLPRRSGTLQLNHLVASLFAQGVELDPSYLYARRRPQHLALELPPPAIRPGVELKLGFPEMRLSDAMRERLRSRVAPAEIPFELNAPLRVEVPPTPMAPLATMLPATAVADSPSDADEAMLAYFETMNAFLETQQAVSLAYLGAAAADEGQAAAPLARESQIATGPWAGTIVEHSPGRRVVTRFALDADRDPVALNHTLGGRRVSALDPALRGLPVLPFAVMAEMLAEVGALLAPPGWTLAGVEDVCAYRWVGYEEGLRAVEIRGECDPLIPDAVRVAIHTLGADGTPSARAVFEGVARFAAVASEPPPAGPFGLTEPRRSRFTARQLYEEQWLFHGPPFQALAEVGSWSPTGCSGTIRLLPEAGLLEPGRAGRFRIDPIALDVFTHLLGCWGLDCLERGGDVIFPLRLGRLDLHGDRPPDGTPIACRIHVRSIEHSRVRVDAELVRPDGRVWMAIRDWEDWRFHWPARYRDVFRAPDRVLVGEPLELAGVDPVDACAVWLEPPADMGRPVWRDVLERVQLGPDERAACEALGGPERRRAHRLWGRVAAKEAARRLWLDDGRPARYPADLRIEPDDRGRPVLLDLARPEARDLPAVSIAHCEGVAVALAARDATTRVGIDVEPIRERSSEFEAAAFTPAERILLDRDARWPRAEAVARFWTAKEAAAKATGLGFLGVPAHAEVVRVRADGALAVRLGGPLAETGTGAVLAVRTERRGQFIWSWTLGEEHEP